MRSDLIIRKNKVGYVRCSKFKGNGYFRTFLPLCLIGSFLPTYSGTSKQSVKKNLEFDPDSELTEIEVEPYIQVKLRDAELPFRITIYLMDCCWIVPWID